jgi:hypothetical protein
MPSKTASSVRNKQEQTIKPGKKLPEKTIYNLIQIAALPDSHLLSTSYDLDEADFAFKLFTFNGKKLIEQSPQQDKFITVDSGLRLSINMLAIRAQQI